VPGFRRNDKKGRFLTFYETIKFKLASSFNHDIDQSKLTFAVNNDPQKPGAKRRNTCPVKHMKPPRSKATGLASALLVQILMRTNRISRFKGISYFVRERIMETPHLNPRRKKERTVKTKNHSQKNHAIADTIFCEKTPLLQKNI